MLRLGEIENHMEEVISHCYNFKVHNPQAIATGDLFLNHTKLQRKTIYRMPYPKRFTREETRNYVFEEFMRQVLLDIIENNTIFVHNNLSRFHITISKKEVTGDAFLNFYKKNRFKLDYLKSNFTGHFIMMDITKYSNGRSFSFLKNVFLSGDLKKKRDKASEIW